MYRLSFARAVWTAQVRNIIARYSLQKRNPDIFWARAVMVAHYLSSKNENMCNHGLVTSNSGSVSSALVGLKALASPPRRGGRGAARLNLGDVETCSQGDSGLYCR